jgi:hypothetical protein
MQMSRIPGSIPTESEHGMQVHDFSTGPLALTTPAGEAPAGVVMLWLDYHTPPVRVLSTLRAQTRPTMLVTDHTQAAVGLARFCAALRVICAPAALAPVLDELLTLLPHLHGGPLVLAAASVTGGGARCLTH